MRCLATSAEASCLPEWLPRCFIKTENMKKSEDGNPGTVNAFRYGGFWCGLITLCGDLLKGFIPIFLFASTHEEEIFFMPGALVLAAPVLGHAFPLFHRFRGGKGIAVSFGCLLGLMPFWRPFAILAGFFLLYIFGVKRPLGQFFLEFFGVKIAFSWGATVLAAVVISFPLMYRSARGAFEQVDANLLYAGRTLGMSEWKIFWRVLFPNALSGILSGGILAFARGLGEFGATAMIAGNIAGKTRTLPLAVYSHVSAGDMEGAYQYVLILVVISFFVVTGMNYATYVFQKYNRR